MKAERFWKILAGALSVAAMAMTVNTTLSAPRLREILIQKEADLQQVQSAQSRWAQEDVYRLWLDAKQAWTPTDLDELATRTLGEGIARISPRPAVTIIDGWQLREATVKINEAPYDEIALFLSHAAENPPTWRLREIDIRPSAEQGKGAMTCVLEALEKKQP